MERIETLLATITRPEPRLLVVRFRPLARVDAIGIAAIMTERKRMCGDTRVAALVVLADEAELDPAAMSVDHYRANEAVSGILALAIVAPGIRSGAIIRLYMAYYQWPFRSHVFTNEQEALNWLHQELGPAEAPGT